MNFGNDGTNKVCPPPNPLQYRPKRLTLPQGTVDTHAHVIGHTFVPDRSYTPPPASGEQYLAMLDAVGFTYGVLVQISVHGTDNNVMLDVVGNARERLRAIAVVDADADDRTLAHLHDSGVVGLRLNTLSRGGIGLDNLARYDAICTEMGWHLQFLTNTEHLTEAASSLRELTAPFVVDHMGDFDVTRSTDSPEWKLFLDLMSHGAWTKLSGAFRMSNSADYSDTIPFAQSLVAASPDRCVWGSDWPHVGFWGNMPDLGKLLDLLPDWIPETTTLEAVLTTNAHRLYGFDQ